MRLRDVAAVDPPSPGFARVDAGTLISFLPLERIWHDSRFDASQTIEFDGETRSYNRVLEGDLLVPKVAPTFGRGRVAIAQGLTNRRALATSEVFVVRTPDPAAVRFLQYRLQAADFLGTGMASWTGVAGLKRISSDFVRSARILRGAWKLREEIADFLDAATAEIDSMTHLRRRQVRLLAERLAATEDLELNLGEDRSWTTCRLSQLCDASRPIQYGIVLPGPDLKEGVLLVKGGDVKPGRLHPERLARTSPDIESSYARSRLATRDLVVAIRGAVGDVELVPDSLIGANITQDVARIAPRPDVDEIWLLHALRSSQIQAQAASMVTGATIKGINIGDLRMLLLQVPPVATQRQLGRKLAARSAAYSKLFTAINRQIALLAERRQSLITAAVNGKLQVPDAGTANAVA